MNNEPIPRLSRLSAIITILQSNKLVTSTMLSKRFEVSVRTIYRDIRALEKSGVPVYTEEGKGYRLMDGYSLPPIMFSESEANALITAHRIILQNRDQSLIDEYTNAIGKIKAVLRNDDKSKTSKLEGRIAYMKNLGRVVSSDYLMDVQGAITNQNIVVLKYTAGYDGNTTSREVEPMAIYNSQENWIVIAWCRLRKDFRDFRLDRIEELVISTSVFEDREFDLLAYFMRNIPG